MRRFIVFFLALFVFPLAAHAVWWQLRDHAQAWNRADWSSAGILPAPAANPAAMVRIYAARTGRWKGIFAHHSWIVLKEAGAASYSRFDKVGWGQPVRLNNWAADGRWFGHEPELVAAFDGAQAQALIPRLRAAIAAYPHDARGGYTIWPGPNSNSFIAHVIAAVPDAGIVLPPTALGKDFRASRLYAGPPPSGRGWQLSLFGLAGVTISPAEGFEINLLGLVTGFDVAHPAIKLPGWGRIAF